jgi:hypothetical protein
MTSFDAFCYTTMSFRLKNAGATYQRGIYNGVYTPNSGATLKHMLMIWSSRLGKMESSSLT